MQFFHYTILQNLLEQHVSFVACRYQIDISIGKRSRLKYRYCIGSETIVSEQRNPIQQKSVGTSNRDQSSLSVCLLVNHWNEGETLWLFWSSDIFTVAAKAHEDLVTRHREKQKRCFVQPPQTERIIIIRAQNQKLDFWTSTGEEIKFNK